MRMRVGLPAPSDAPSHAGNFSDSTEARLLRDSYCEVIANPSHLPERIQTMEGFSGGKYRALINLVVSRLPKARYLEVGSWKGSTVCAEHIAIGITDISWRSSTALRFIKVLGRQIRNTRSPSRPTRKKAEPVIDCGCVCCAGSSGDPSAVATNRELTARQDQARKKVHPPAIEGSVASLRLDDVARK